MLTALDSEADVVQGLEAGRRRLRHEAVRAGRAAQPHPRRAAPRARPRSSTGTVKVGPVVLDQRQREVTVDGAAVRLTFSEFELLGCLMERPGRLFNRQELLRAIWGDSAYRDPRAIDVHIRHLREKLEATPRAAAADPHRPRRGLPLPGAMRRRRLGLRPRLLVGAARHGGA